MTQMEESINHNKDIYVWSDKITSVLKSVFRTQELNGYTYYLKDNGEMFCLLEYTSPLYGFILEMSADEETAINNCGIDIGEYPLLDYDSPEEMLEYIMNNVNQGMEDRFE
ncbi:MAG: hypothetical protein J5865_01425 [Lachnospiraceae bacterium]|nr:hypothetical protein [Lachnospiraceae bacterium]